MVWMNCKQFATDNREAPEGNNLNGYVLEAMKEDLVNEFGEAWNCLWIHLDCSMEEGAREFSGNLGFGFILYLYLVVILQDKKCKYATVFLLEQ